VAASLNELHRPRGRDIPKSDGDSRPGFAVLALPVRPLAGGEPMAVGVGGRSRHVRRKRRLILRALHTFTATYR